MKIKLNGKMIRDRLCETETGTFSLKKNTWNPGRDGLNNLYTQRSDFSDLDLRIRALYTNVQCNAKRLAR